MKTQNGSMQLVMIVVAVLVILGLLGFVLWQNFVRKDDDTGNAETRTSTTDSTNTNTKEPADDTKYVTLDIWNVKFKAPTDNSTVKWAVSNYGSNSIGFITSNLTEDSEMCNAENAAAGSLDRSKDPITPPLAGATMMMVHNGEPIDGYYYAFTVPNGSHCGNQNPSDEDEAHKLQDLVVNSLVAI